MWCLVFIALAGTAPPTDCSIVYEEECKMLAAAINIIEWQDNTSNISHLAMCIQASEKAKYHRAKMRNEMIQRAIEAKQ